MKTYRYSNRKTKKLKKKYHLTQANVLLGGSEVPGVVEVASARGSSLGDYLKVPKEQQYSTNMSQLFLDLDKEGELLEVYQARMKTLYEKEKTYDVSDFFNNTSLNRDFGKQRDDLILKTKKRRLNISLLSILHDINLETSYPRTDKYNLARRLEIVVDITSQKGDINCKLAQLLIERLRIVENLLDLHKIVGILEFLPQGIKTIKELELYYGEKQTGIEYIGTNYELVPAFKEGYVGIEKYILEKETPRDIFMVDFDYPSLNNPTSVKNKLSVYQSSGSSYSNKQKGMLSPFQGKSLKTIVPYDRNNTRNSTFRDVMIKVASILFPNIFDDLILFGSTNRSLLTVSVTGASKLNLSYNMVEWNRMIESGVLSHCWYIKFSSFIEYTKDGIINMNSDLSYDGWANCDMVYNMLGGEFVGRQIQNGGIIVTDNYLKIKSLENSLKIMELIVGKSNKKDIESNLDIFYNRFFGSDDLYSMRHMANFSYTTQTISDVEMNTQIGNQNIFDKDLNEEGRNTNKTSGTIGDIAIGRLEKKIMSYFFECLYYHDPDSPGKTSLSDLEKVLFLFGARDLSYELVMADKHYRFNPESSLEKIVEILRIVGLIIIMDSPDSKKYKDTIFYNIMLLPFYDDLINPAT